MGLKQTKGVLNANDKPSALIVRQDSMLQDTCCCKDAFIATLERNVQRLRLIRKSCLTPYLALSAINMHINVEDVFAMCNTSFNFKAFVGNLVPLAHENA